MKILELQFPKTINDAGLILKQYGYKKISKVSRYASVYYKEGEKTVLKLFNKKDIAYISFVEFCLHHQDNTHLPKFSKNAIKIKDTNYFAVRTEILKKCPENVGKMLTDYFDGMVYIKRKYGSFVEFQQENQMLIYDTLYYIFQNDDKINKFLSWVKNNSLFETFNMIIEQFNGKFSFDMHSDNLMLRGSTIVIIDPIQP